jgi:hypothetical protein
MHLSMLCNAHASTYYCIFSWAASLVNLSFKRTLINFPDLSIRVESNYISGCSTCSSMTSSGQWRHCSPTCTEPPPADPEVEAPKCQHRTCDLPFPCVVPSLSLRFVYLPISLGLYTKTVTGEATSPFSLFTVSRNTVLRNSIGSRNTVHTR